MAKNKAERTGAKDAPAIPARKSVIKELRKRSGRTLESLAPLVGVSVSQLYRIESKPWSASVEQIERLAGALGVQVSDLLADPQTMNPLQIPHTRRALPILEMSELGSRGTRSGKPRSFIAPWSEVSDSAFWLANKGHANVPEFLDGDMILIDPQAPLAVGDNAVAEVLETGEILVGKYLPLQAADNKTPEFMIEPYNARPTRCTRDNPGKIIGRIMEKRVVYR